MAAGKRRNPSVTGAHATEPVLAAVVPLAEIITALLPGTRLTTVSLCGDTLEIVASTGAGALPVGVALHSSYTAEMPSRLAQGPIVAAIDDVDVPVELREPLSQLGFQRGLVAMLHPIDSSIYCVVIDRAGGALSLSETERHVLVAAIEQASDGISNAALSHQAAVASKNLETIVHLGVALGSVLDLDVIAAQTVEYASLLLDLPAAALLFRGAAEADFAMVASEGLPSGLSRLPVTSLEIAGLETAWPASVAENHPDSLLGALSQRGLANTFVAALGMEDGRAGVLLGLDRPERRPTDEERNAFQLLAIQSATAMRSAGLYRDVVEAQRVEALELARTALLNEVTVAATSSLTLTKVADRVLAALAKAMDIKIGAVYLYDESSLHLVLLADYDMDVTIREEVREIQVGVDSPTLESRAALSERIVTNEDVEMTEARREMLRRAGLGTTQNVAIPLQAGEGVLGTCSFVFERDEPISPDELALFRSIGGILAQAIDNSQLLNRTMENSRLSDALNVANAMVHSTLDIDGVMQSALDTGLEALACEAAAIAILDGDDWVVRYQHGFFAEAVGMPLGKADASNAALAAEQGIPIVADTVPGPREIYHGSLSPHALNSVLAVPLMARTEVFGCALFYCDSAASHFSDAEIDFGHKLGSAASLSYENVRLYESEHRIAETLQQAMLALPNRLPGIEFEAYYHSATESTFVGGDFYDLFELDSRRVGIIIGDIAGKGLAAAVLTSLVKNTIRAYAFEKGAAPAEILRLTNDVVVRTTPVETYATVFFSVLDREDGQLCYASGGHTRCAILRGDGTTAMLESTGPPVGAFAGVDFGESRTVLGQRETLFLYTDGLTEARRDGEFYGEARLFADLGLAERVSTRDLTARVVANVMAFARGHLRDDLAILALAPLDGVTEDCRQRVHTGGAVTESL